jgi:drug/metabolite transporter (DMT)-like permease
MFQEVSLLVSEIALSLYPQLIKLVPATLEIQMAVRFLTYCIMALLGYFTFGGKSLFVVSNIKSKSSSWWYYIVMGIVNIFHILSSYASYKLLPSGVAYSLFYTYPILNLLSRSMFFGESFNIWNYLYIAIAIVGVYFVYSNGHVEGNIKGNAKSELPSWLDNIVGQDRIVGLLMGIGSAFTESLIYLMVKADAPSVSPFIQIIKTYLVGGIFSIVYLIKYLDSEQSRIVANKLDWNYWVTLILFNLIIGFIGYVIRFITIPRLSTLAFNSLIFIGVIFSYIWGYVFSEEKIKTKNVFGTLLIIASVFQLNR